MGFHKDFRGFFLSLLWICCCWCVWNMSLLFSVKGNNTQKYTQHNSMKGYCSRLNDACFGFGNMKISRSKQPRGECCMLYTCNTVKKQIFSIIKRFTFNHNSTNSKKSLIFECEILPGCRRHRRRYRQDVCYTREIFFQIFIQISCTHIIKILFNPSQIIIDK